MKPRLDLISIDERFPVPAVKKRKAREVFTDIIPAENNPMLKSAYQFSKEVSRNSLSNFHVFLPEFHFPFYILLWVGAIMFVNAALSVFNLRRMRH